MAEIEGSERMLGHIRKSVSLDLRFIQKSPIIVPERLVRILELVVDKSKDEKEQR